MQFHIWYLKENGWVQRLENGQYAITVQGVDKLVESDIPWRRAGQGLLPSGTEAPTADVEAAATEPDTDQDSDQPSETPASEDELAARGA